MFDALGAAIAAIIAARGHIATAHRSLSDVRDAYQLPIVDTGGGDQKPPRFGITQAAPLQSVA